MFTSAELDLIHTLLVVMGVLFLVMLVVSVASVVWVMLGWWDEFKRRRKAVREQVAEKKGN